MSNKDFFNTMRYESLKRYGKDIFIYDSVLTEKYCVIINTHNFNKLFENPLIKIILIFTSDFHPGFAFFNTKLILSDEIDNDTIIMQEYTEDIEYRLNKLYLVNFEYYVFNEYGRNIETYSFHTIKDDKSYIFNENV